MNDREKLIDLIIDAKRRDPETGSFTEFLADNLIANGVTVQKWIPVSERLPDKNGRYLAFLKYVKCTMILNFALDFIEHDEYGLLTEKKKSCFYYCDDDWELIEVPEVTHWMPLPQPPKGE